MLEPQPIALTERIVQALSKADASRTTLSKALGVSRTTLTRGLNGLIEGGFVTVTPRPGSGRGRPTETLHLDASVPYTAGIAIAKRAARGVIVNRVGEVLVAIESPLESASWHDSLRQTGERLVAEAAARWPEAKPACVGIGLPVPIVASPGIRETAARIAAEVFPGIDDDPNPASIVVTENIVTMAAIGESRWGAAMGAGSLLYIHLSSGIGSCFVMRQPGTGGLAIVASELGHTVVPGSQHLCFCGKIGCLETVATIPAVLQSAGVDTAEELEQQLTDGEAGTNDVLAKVAHAVGLAAANAVLMTNPEMVVVGGALPRLSDSFVAKVHRSLTDHLLPAFGWDVDVTRSEMDKWGAARGAALLAGEKLTLNQAEQILGERA